MLERQTTRGGTWSSNAAALWTVPGSAASVYTIARLKTRYEHFGTGTPTQVVLFHCILSPNIIGVGKASLTVK
jgi:hypothetical protein